VLLFTIRKKIVADFRWTALAEPVAHEKLAVKIRLFALRTLRNVRGANNDYDSYRSQNKTRTPTPFGVIPMRMSHPLIYSLCLLVLIASATHAADPKAVVFTDPKKAGIEFELQGEYLGEIDTDNGKRPMGVQLIALGEGKFRGVGFHGGLPGAGWVRGGTTHSADGKLENGVVRLAADDVTVEAQGGKLSISVDGQLIGVLKKVTRKSPTLGAKPPAGALVLFDGTSVDAFENGKLVDGKYLAASNVSTKRKFGDHSIHIEFRTPFMPTSKGQGRGNSGVYIQGRYEMQVLDSFGLEGENDECGGIYSISEPAVNMCFPPLSWQTYDFTFTAARYDDTGKKVKNARTSVKHNGVVIHDDIELTHGTPGRHPEGPGPDALFLQDHHNPVVFRNIWVVEK